MMIKSHDICHFVLVAFAASILLSGCNEIDPVNVNISAKYDPVFFGKDIGVSLNNKGKHAICLLKKNLDPTLPDFEVYQNNKIILPDRQSNREIVLLNGMDVSGGIEVVPSGYRTFFVSMSNFTLEPGPFSIIIRVKVTKCTEIFSTKKIEWHTLTGKVAGSFS